MSKRCLAGPINRLLERPSDLNAPLLSTPIARQKDLKLHTESVQPGDRSTAISLSRCGNEHSFLGERRDVDGST